MTDLQAARTLIAGSLGFRILFAVVGIGLPLMMVLARRWAKGTAVLFAIGAVSGTILSFQLGLLWPEFMRWAGAIVGLAFSLESAAFFTEAVFLGRSLYGWRLLSPVAHLASGLAVAVSGATSGIFIVLANGWTNTPRGFRLLEGLPADIDPVAAMFNPSGLAQVPI